MLNSGLKKAWKMGRIAALAFLIALQPPLMLVPGTAEASVASEDAIFAGQGGDPADQPIGEPADGGPTDGSGMDNGEPGDGSVDVPSDGKDGDSADGMVEQPQEDPVDDSLIPEGEEKDPLLEPVGAGELASQEIHEVKPLFNNGFEETLNADGTIPGWSMFFAPNEGTSHEISQDMRYYGTSSLKLVDKSNTLPIYVQSDPHPVTPGYTYNGSAMMYIAPNAGNAAGASLVLRFYDAAGKQVNTDKDGENIVHLRTVGSWTRVTVTGIAPSNAVNARLAASISNYFTAESGAFYDDFTLTSPQEEKAPGTLHLQMPTGISGSQQLEAKIMLSRGQDVQKAFGSLRYDPTVLEVVYAAVASDFHTGGEVKLDWSHEAGVLKFEVSKTAGSSVSDDKQIINVTFKVLGEPDRVDVTLLTGSGLQDSEGIQNNKIYIGTSDERSSTYIRRASLDVNGDGKIDLFDVMAVAKMVGQMATGDNWKYDINNDGRIDHADVEALTNAILSKLLNLDEGGHAL
ncbi:dockerin type I domain-containing protein [Paenibacillaceae sp. P-4]|uniref:dockerin type I domain-containing protein n=1 Tax=Paenibacillaceae bacterium P-4 TaxID=3160969 RepID=UPI0032E84CA4